ncbi:MATH and LRR domain-containing protein PFE0570w-like, partial [Stegodyphus dumicola]|uniref:MATH and LRR domain-containing protein PFE0570w-like n=1 Tax=Stegodyphus dumicola TaxID=202533 RepID=UPI0015AC9BB9
MKEKVVICPSCKHCSRNPNVCDSCKNEITGAAVYQLNTDRAEKVAVPFVVTKNYVTTTEQIYYHVKNPTQAALLCQNQSFHFQQLVAVQGNEAAPVIRVGAAKPKARPKAKRRCIEPAVCVTISSDDEEESVQESFMPENEETSSSAHFYQLEMEGDKSRLSTSPSDLIQDENMEADEPQFPGVTNINMRPNEDDVEYEEEEEEEEEPDEEEMDGMDVEEEEDMEEEGEEECSEEEEEEEEEDVPPEEETGHDGQLQLRMPLTVKVFNVDHPLKCRSIRIGSLKVHPKGPLSYVPVHLSSDGIAFEAPTLTNPEKFNNVLITANDVAYMLVHFGKCLPIVFVFTTRSFGESMRNLLCMSEDDYRYFDPDSNDDKQKKITLLIDSMTEDQRRYLRYGFSGDNKIKEIDQKTANEILVRSTPNQLPPGKYTIYTHAAIQHESASPVLQ